MLVLMLEIGLLRWRTVGMPVFGGLDRFLLPQRMILFQYCQYTSWRLVYTAYMSTVGAFDAKTHLPALLERAQKGEHITITKHGVPVARLVPAASGVRKERRRVIAELKEFGKGRSLPEGMTVRDLIEEGRRF
jgi:prevent-host-death family protein